MQILPNLLSDDQIISFQSYWNRNPDRIYVNYVDAAGNIVDRRCTIDHNSPEWQTVMSVVNQHFDRPLEVWAAYQRQTTPHSLHIDDYGIETWTRDKGVYTYTYIIAPETQPKFKSIIWKRQSFCNQDMCQEILNDLSKMIPNNNLTAVEDLEHMPLSESGIPISNYLELDGMFTYERGSGCLFSAKQWHASSYWSKYPEFAYRDLLQFHVVSRTPCAAAEPVGSK
jgi:hypothetical protein